MRTTEGRLHAATASHVSDRVRRETDERVARIAHGGRDVIDRRLAQLDEEWDIERTLMANAATISLIGLLLGATLTPWLYLLPALVAGFLLQHAVQGWCPPIGIFRRLGRRTAGEIAVERYALKAIRGDFEDVHPPKTRSTAGGVAARTMERVRA